jgi:hypothetical protein
MGARLRYAKVIDRKMFFVRGGKLHPGLENEVLLDEEPGIAGAFLVMRGWSDNHGSVTEQWRIEGPGGMRIYNGLPRELHFPTEQHIERLEDEVTDLKIDIASDDYNVVLLLDEEEVARVRFSVRVEERPTFS